MPVEQAAAPVLELRGVNKVYMPRRGLLGRRSRRGRTVFALTGIDLSVAAGEVVGVVGESGSGKSTLAQIAVKLVPPSSGRILHDRRDVTTAEGRSLASFRSQVQMIFQDTASSLNPRKTVRTTITEALALAKIGPREREAEALRLLHLVGLDGFVLPRYPHQLSGGQRQRIGITRALAMRPRLLIADEPVSSLDVSLQAQIMELLLDLQQRLHLTMLFITHDLALASQISNRIAVMHRGRIVELGMTEDVLLRPLHPYTQALIASVPAGIDGRGRSDGEVPVTSAETEDRRIGCPYAARCIHAAPVCRHSEPPAVPVSDSWMVRCHLLSAATTTRDP